MLQKNGDCSWAWEDHHLEKDNLWATIREEVQKDSQSEAMLASFLYSTVLAHSSIEESLAFILANKLHCPVLPATQLMQLFHEVFTADELRADFLADLLATYERDPACKKYR
jgi:serine O-acetyltransferase